MNCICTICGRPFVSYNPRPRFCSLECKYKSQQATVDSMEIANLYRDGKTQQEIATILGTTQKVIFSSLRRLGFKCRVAKKRDQYGERNLRWVGGRTKTDKGYVLLRRPDYHRSYQNGYVPEHVFVAEKMIGRKLFPDEIVHHKNGVKTDNSEENLQVMTRVDHGILHNPKGRRCGFSSKD